MLLARVVEASNAMASTSARLRKIAVLAELVASCGPDEVDVVVGYLSGQPPQGRIGVGYAAVYKTDTLPAPEATLAVTDVDRAIDVLRDETGAGSAGRRASLLADLFGRATAPEQDFLRRLFTGEMRQGALEGVAVEAVAKGAGVPAAKVRRALMLSSDLGRVARVALTGGDLDAIGLTVGHGIKPMLASTASSVSEAMDGLAQASVEWKVDGIRIQAHRDGDDVRIFTRNQNPIELPDVADAIRSLPVARAVLDGEAIWLGDGERPEAFQDTMGRIGRRSVPATGIRAWLFDVLHIDGDDLLDVPLAQRLERLEAVASHLRIPGVVTDDPSDGERVLADAIEAGHEGVVVKDVDSLYVAGRRGKSWRKVKPVRTLDLVVLGAEWGHGRRRGWLSNLHLGARDPSGGFVMVGKTFKGLTDELLTWQTEQFLAREDRREGITVFVRPELVVEIALDGVQTSTRYPGGVALRFARVKRYRPDKDPSQADTIDAVRDLR